MSQTNVTLLEEVEQWSPDTCKKELKTVLPKLVISFHYTWQNAQIVVNLCHINQVFGLTLMQQLYTLNIVIL